MIGWYVLAPMIKATAAPLHLLGISGSLRSGSFNTALLGIVQDLLPNGWTFELADLHDIPLYNLDVERTAGFPEPVVRLRDQISAADGVVISTPEYNFSVPGVLKNAIDWASRHGDSPMNHKPMAIGGVAGGSGSQKAQEHLRTVLGHNRVRVMARPELLVARGSTVFVEGEPVDPDLVARVGRWLEAFGDFVAWSQATPIIEPGTVLLVADEADTLRLARDRLGEYGMRSIATLGESDALDAIRTRGIAAMAVEAKVPPAIRAALDAARDEHRPGTPTVGFLDPDLVGHAVVTALTAT